jgi:hypothetical protein
MIKRTTIVRPGVRSRGMVATLILTVAVLMLLPTVLLVAEDASVVYLEGDPEVRTAAGATDWLDFGSRVRSGDSVVTGRFDMVELEQGPGASIRVDPGTVFTIREVERDGRRENVMTNSVGSVSYRFQRVTGRAEPRVGTAATVAGVRGTELTVYAGADGSSMFLVETGEVEVSSAGESVSLFANEGVEVPAGRPPGQKFEIIGRAIDFSDWASDKRDEFLQDPLRSLDGVAVQLEEYYRELAELQELYADARGRYDEIYADLTAAVEEYGRESEEADALREILSPVSNEATTHAFNIRYFALTALSARRHLLGQMYVEMRSRYILDRSNPRYTGFASRYSEVLDRYENQVITHLVDVDI